MEHRWGRRIQSDMLIQLKYGSCVVLRARLTDLSLTGAGVDTRNPLPLAAHVDVQFVLARPRSSKLHSVPAHVVRHTEHGLAVEWCEFAPRPIRLLMAVLRMRTGRTSGPELAQLASVPVLARELRSRVLPASQPAHAMPAPLG